MPSDFRCTQCGRPLQAGDASPGTRILCAACGAFSPVPAPEAAAPIEFRCTGCNKLLRTPADTAGKQAKCPECGQIVSVPGPGVGVPAETLPYPSPSSGAPLGSPFAPAASAPVAPSDAENPYLAPTQYGQPSFQPFAGADPMAASRVAGPAIALIVTGALGIVGQVLGLIVNLVQLGGGMGRAGQQQMPVMFSGGFGVFSAMVGLIFGIVVVMGAVKMKNLESYGFAMAAAVMAMVPCLSPCCLLGLPFGIWALVVLSDAGVKAAFRS
jgi:phage FluMu protein Com